MRVFRHASYSTTHTRVCPSCHLQALKTCNTCRLKFCTECRCSRVMCPRCALLAQDLRRNARYYSPWLRPSDLPQREVALCRKLRTPKAGSMRPHLKAQMDARCFMCLHRLVSATKQRRGVKSVTPFCKDVAVVGRMYKDHVMRFVAHNAIPSIVFFSTKR